jgi:hypothetical protein
MRIGPKVAMGGMTEMKRNEDGSYNLEDLESIVTEDGVEVRVGDTVFNYYDCWWGIITKIGYDGWANVLNEDSDYDGPVKGRGTLLDGSRISMRDYHKGTRPKNDKEKETKEKD